MFCFVLFPSCRGNQNTRRTHWELTHTPHRLLCKLLRCPNSICECNCEMKPKPPKKLLTALESFWMILFTKFQVTSTMPHYWWVQPTHLEDASFLPSNLFNGVSENLSVVYTQWGDATHPRPPVDTQPQRSQNIGNILLQHRLSCWLSVTTSAIVHFNV